LGHGRAGKGCSNGGGQQQLDEGGFGLHDFSGFIARG
jgi:hypothetical protein